MWSAVESSNVLQMVVGPNEHCYLKTNDPCDSDEFEAWMHHHNNGSNDGNLNAPRRAEYSFQCRRRCSNNPMCFAFVYNHQTKMCALKENNTSLVKSVTPMHTDLRACCANSIHWFEGVPGIIVPFENRKNACQRLKTREYCQPGFSLVWTSYKQLDSFEKDIDEIFKVNEVTCRQLCYQNVACVVAGYRQHDKRCVLKHTAEKFEPVTKWTYMAYALSCCPPTMTCSISCKQ